MRDLERRRGDFDFFIFFSYRYYTTYHGLRAVGDKALLVPTAEDDGVYRLSIFPPLFRLPRAHRLQQRRGAGHDRAASRQPGRARRRRGRGLGAAGSLDADGFRRAPRPRRARSCSTSGGSTRTRAAASCSTSSAATGSETGSALRLVLVGKPVLPVPADPGIVSLGFLPDAEKWNALAAADLLVMPSRYESLSMVTLEAWWAERPVLANARCDVLRGQCQRSNAGLYYSSYDEFREALALLEADRGAARGPWARTAAATSRRTTPGT